MLKIISAPNPVLSQEAKKISKVDKSVLKLIKEMEQTLLSAQDPIGVGLAAPQVGVSLQLFITKPTPKSKIQVFINPKILTRDTRNAISDEKKETGLPADLSAETFAKEEALAKAGPRANETGPADNKKKNSTKLEGCLSLQNIWGEVKRDPEIILQYQLITPNSQLITKTNAFSGFMATIIQHETDHLNGVLFPKRVLEQKGILYKSRKNEKGEDVFEEIEV